MSASADDLARRLVAAPGFRWMPGMLTVDPGNGGVQRLVAHDDTYWHAHSERTAWLRYRHDIMGRLVPALSHDDPATEGCLLRLAREAWAAAGWEGLELHTVGEGVAVVFVQHIGRDGWQSFRAPTPSEALAHAILAAGEVRDV